MALLKQWAQMWTTLLSGVQVSNLSSLKLSIHSSSSNIKALSPFQCYSYKDPGEREKVAPDVPTDGLGLTARPQYFLSF